MSELTDRLALIIDARTDGAVSSIRKLSLEEQAAAERTDLLTAKIADLETKMAKSATGGTAVQQRQLANLNGEYKALNSNLASTATRAGRVEGALSKVGLGGLASSSTLGAIGKVGPGLVAGAAAFGGFEFLKSGIEDFTELADEIRGVAQAASSSAPDASRLVAITHALGLDSNVAALGLFRLGKNIDQTPEKLARYNVEIAKTRQGSTDLIGTLANVAEAYQQTQDPAQRAGLVYQAFGRAGVSMLPILNANADQLREIAAEAGKMGRIFTADDLQRARDYQIAGRELQAAWQGFAISAARDLVPLLTDINELLTKGAEISRKFPIGAAFLPTKAKELVSPAYALYHHFFGGTTAPDTAAQLQAEQDQAARDALAQQAAGVFGGAFDQLAGPQGVRDAKESLRQAKQSLADARAERAKAVRDLASVRGGSPTASASQIEAAVSRVQAAEERLQIAQYKGGSGVASARAALLSAQSSLNKMRQQGGVDTNKLADAEERLRKANQAVAEQQRKAREAQRAENQAHGLTAQQALNRLTKQAGASRQKETDESKLLNLGLTPEAFAQGIAPLEQKLPGSLHRIAATATRGLVKDINTEFAKKQLSETLAESLISSGAFSDAGRKAGRRFAEGFDEGWGSFNGKTGGNALPTGRRPSTQIPNTRVDVLQSQYGITPVTVQGDLVVKGHSARHVAKEVARNNRLRGLTHGQEHSGWDD